MGTRPTFSPLDIYTDNGRFGNIWFHFEQNEKPISGLLELLDLYHPEWEGAEDRNNLTNVSWLDANLIIHYRDVENRHAHQVHLPSGQSIQLTPRWTHSGYTMCIDGRGTSKLIWISLSSARQYRWGLSSRALEGRSTSHWNTLGHEQDISLATAASVFEHGPVYIPVARVDLSTHNGAALTNRLAIHRITDTIGALTHNCQTVLGFYVDGNLQAEHRARPLTLPIQEHINYVSTEELTHLYTTTILTGELGLGQPQPERPVGDAPRRVRPRTGAAVFVHNTPPSFDSLRGNNSNAAITTDIDMRNLLSRLNRPDVVRPGNRERGDSGDEGPES